MNLPKHVELVIRDYTTKIKTLLNEINKHQALIDGLQREYADVSDDSSENQPKQIVQQSVQIREKPTVRVLIIDLLKSNPNGLTSIELLDRLQHTISTKAEWPRGCISSALSRMVKIGMCARTLSGKKRVFKLNAVARKQDDDATVRDFPGFNM